MSIRLWSYFYFDLIYRCDSVYEMTLEQEQFVNEIVLETQRILESKSPKNAEMYRNFLAKFIGMMVYRSLEANPEVKLTNDQLFKFKSKNFLNMKTLVSDVVAAAMGGAMRKFSGKDIEYYCQIKTVGEPVNKEPI